MINVPMGRLPSSTSAKVSSRIFNKKDANQDGMVTFQEELAYDLAHPAEAMDEDANNTETKVADIGYDRFGAIRENSEQAASFDIMV